jgi:hypothetical protein
VVKCNIYKVFPVSSRHFDGSNNGVSRWSDKVTQKYGRNKDGHSHSIGSNIPKISREVVGEKEVQKATNSSQHESLI